MNRTASETRSRKVLVPLATLVVAGAVAVGSGASFTSTTNSATSVTAGTLVHSNTRDGQTLTIANIKPGDVRTGTLTITNTGTLDSELSLTELAGGNNGFANNTAGNSMLDLKIQSSIDGAAATTVYDGDFGGLVDGTPVVVGDLLKSKVAVITFTVTLESEAVNDNANQGKSAKAGFRWVTTQKNDNSSVSWLPGL